MRSIRSLFAAAIATVLAGLVVGLTPTNAHAADIYRYWAYFSATDSEFVSASTGPSDAKPADGSIEGYRYAAPADFITPNLPRADLSKVTFDSVCGDTSAADDEKRVAVLIDYGVKEDAAKGATPPEAQALCSVTAKDANGLQVLEKVAPDLRTESGSYGPMLCGIGNYPTTGCSEAAKTGTPADSETIEFTKTLSTKGTGTHTDEDSNAPLLIGVGAIVVLLGAGGFYLARRRGTSA